MPNIVEFAIGPEFLNLSLYPRQATWLKLVFCSAHLLTDYDHAVLAEWSSGFCLEHRSDGSAGFRGSYGIAPDTLQRIGCMQELGRGWFREVVLVAGRRGSKGLMGAVSAAYVLWHQLQIPDPWVHYGIPRGKQVHAQVFAGQRDQALTNQYRDLVEVIRAAPCFQPFLAPGRGNSLRLYSAAQVDAGVDDPDEAMFVISGKESTTLAGRGPATVIQLFDEMAHMVAGGANRSAEEVFTAATPALAQFHAESFLWEASSPWQTQGQFYGNHLRALAVDQHTGDAIEPDMLLGQFPSGEMYRDWELTAGGQLLAWPGGPPLPVKQRAIFDEASAEVHRRTDPATFEVEFNAQWATSMSAYLPPEDVDAIFAGWGGQELHMRRNGAIGTGYVAHADPSRSGANFAVVVAHSEVDQEGRRHVVIDEVVVWQPVMFPDHTIDYEEVLAELKSLLERFNITNFTFDQWNSAGLMDSLKAHTRLLNRGTQVSERRASAPSNTKMYESLKTALTRRLVHSPHHPLMEAELRNLELRNGKIDHPTRGPVQTSDIADCLANVVDSLIGDNNAAEIGRALGAGTVSGSRPAHTYDQEFSAVHPRSAGYGSPRGVARYDPARGDRGRPRFRR